MPYLISNSRVLILLLILYSSFTSQAQNYIFAQLTGSPVNTNGWNLQGGAKVANVSLTDNSEILICPVNSPSGAIFYNQPINLSVCSRWKAEFDFRMHDGTGADGIAFCFLDVPPAGFVSGSGLGIPSSANGLKVCFDTWNNCIPFNEITVHQNMPKVEIRYGAGYDECSNMPTKDNSDGKLSFMVNGEYCHARITYDKGNISVYINDILYLTGFQQFNYAGYLGFTASTGGYTDNHSIKNAVIYTEMPPSEAGNPAAVCPAVGAQLGALSNSDYLYSWTPATGLNATDISNPVVKLDNVSNNIQNHVYYVKTSFKSNPGCSSTDSVTVKVLPKPKVSFITPDICLNDATAGFKDSSYTGEPSLLPFVYLWNFGDPNANGANPNTSSLANPSHRYSAAANYNVKLVVSNNAGCTDSSIKIFTVNGAVPKAGLVVLEASKLCENKTVVLRDASTIDFGRITKRMISWGDSSGVVYTDNDPITGEMYTHNYPVNRNGRPVNYLIRYTVYSGITCVDETTKTITVNPAPQIIFDPVPPLCSNVAPYQVTEAREVTGVQGSFFYYGNAVTGTGIIDPAMGAGVYPIGASFITINGCADSARQTATIYDIPSANAGPDLFVLEGGIITINATATGNNLQYLWTPSTYLNSATLINPVATPLKDISYNLEVTGEGNCKVNDSMKVTVLKSPTIPNAFSPNGDGINDNWMIRYLDTYPGCIMEIYDRYGQLVFRSTGYSRPWDGTRNGKPMPVGVYYYILDTKKHDKPFTGSVTLIR